MNNIQRKLGEKSEFPKEVKNLVSGIIEPGYYSVVWDGKDNQRRKASSGIYFCNLKTENINKIREMILLK